MSNQNLSPADQAMKNKIQSCISTKQTFHMDAYDLEDITEEIYGNRIEMLGSQDDTHEYSVTATHNDSHQKTLQNAIKTGYLDYDYYNVILNDLCEKNYIVAGTYYLST